MYFYILVVFVELNWMMILRAFLQIQTKIKFGVCFIQSGSNRMLYIVKIPSCFVLVGIQHVCKLEEGYVSNIISKITML